MWPIVRINVSRQPRAHTPNAHPLWSIGRVLNCSKGVGLAMPGTRGARDRREIKQKVQKDCAVKRIMARNIKPGRHVYMYGDVDVESSQERGESNPPAGLKTTVGHVRVRVAHRVHPSHEGARQRTHAEDGMRGLCGNEEEPTQCQKTPV